ncbi:hypothetical protein VTO73DRAFT_11688 [Trametes versicolor]
MVPKTSGSRVHPIQGVFKLEVNWQARHGSLGPRVDALPLDFATGDHAAVSLFLAGCYTTLGARHAQFRRPTTPAKRTTSGLVAAAYSGMFPLPALDSATKPPLNCVSLI